VGFTWVLREGPAVLEQGFLLAIRQFKNSAPTDRLYWCSEESRALLKTWADDTVQRQIDGVCRNEEVMKYIVARLTFYLVHKIVEPGEGHQT